MNRLTALALAILATSSMAQFRRQRPSVIHPGVVRSLSFSRYKTSARNGTESSPSPVLDSSRRLPCCQDESSGTVCKAMRLSNPSAFATKCNTEPDFSLVLCCKACNDVTVDYRERGALFFNTQNDTSICFDRMSSSYCSRFQSNADTWSGKRWSCNAEHFRVGFRVCRQSCGFCSMDWRKSPDPVKCGY